MAESGKEPVPIETKDQLIGDLERGVKPKADWRIGTEHEKIAFYKGDKVSPVPFDGERGIEGLLKGLLATNDTANGVYENDRLIGLLLQSEGSDFSASVTLEPGGQVELSGAPLASVHDTKREIETHLHQVREVASELGIGFVASGFSPKFSLEETQRVPKGRYDVMRRYMPKVGKYGLAMMHQSATVQVNLDFSSEADMVRKFQTSLSLQPVIMSMFANSVFCNGELNGFQSFRSELWRDVDDDRTGMLPFVFEDGMSFERYVDYALDVPMYFIYRDGRYHDVTGNTFGDFLNHKIEGFEDVQANMEDWSTHLTTIFPEVRLKQFLEMRGADCGPEPFLTALSAIWTGLLYDTSSLDAAYDLQKAWSERERGELRDNAPRHGLKTPLNKISMIDLAREVIEIAESGLKARAKFDDNGDDERQFLEPLQQIVDEKWSLADRLIDQYKTVWGGDIERLFKDYCF